MVEVQLCKVEWQGRNSPPKTYNLPFAALASCYRPFCGFGRPIAIWFFYATVPASRFKTHPRSVSYAFDRHVTRTLGCYDYCTYSTAAAHGCWDPCAYETHVWYSLVISPGPQAASPRHVFSQALHLLGKSAHFTIIALLFFRMPSQDRLSPACRLPSRVLPPFKFTTHPHTSLLTMIFSLHLSNDLQKVQAP